MKAVFLETSALLRYAFNEKDGVEIFHKLSQADRIVASRLIQVEAARAVIQISQDDPKAAKNAHKIERLLNHLWARVDFIEMHVEICELAARVSPTSRLRSLDAIHLATFRKAQTLEPKIEMLSFDRRILDET